MAKAKRGKLVPICYEQTEHEVVALLGGWQLVTDVSGQRVLLILGSVSQTGFRKGMSGVPRG